VIPAPLPANCAGSVPFDVNSSRTRRTPPQFSPIRPPAQPLHERQAVMLSARLIARLSLLTIFACAPLALGARSALGDNALPPGGDPKVAPTPAPPPSPGGERHVRVNQELGTIEVPPPPFSNGVFPCSDCHNADRTPDPARRELSEHDFKFEHDAEHRWCLDCHSINNYDKLHLSNGDLIDFEESFKLCGQCHGDKYRDWRKGVHGRRTGHWNGAKTYLLCVNCHNPHSPRFKPLKPLPPPVRPERLRRRAGG